MMSLVMTEAKQRLLANRKIERVPMIKPKITVEKKKRVILLAASAEEKLRFLMMLQEDSVSLTARNARDELIAKLS